MGPSVTTATDRSVHFGRSSARDAHAAGAEAATAAQVGLAASLLLVFCSARYDPDELLEGVCSVTPDEAVVAGGTTNGEISGAAPGLEGFPADHTVVVAALGGPGFTAHGAVATGASGDRRAAGMMAASAMEAIDSPHRVLVMIADGMTREQHELIRGAYSVLGMGVPIVGGCSADDLRYARTYQFLGTGAGVQRHTDAVVAVGLGSAAPLGIGIAHGWAKRGEPMVVTASEGGMVFALDDEPAAEAYLRRIGVAPDVLADPDKFREIAFRHPLGMSRRSGEDIRVIHAADAATGALVCLADVPQGALVWTMVTDLDSLVHAASESCAQAVGALGGGPALGVLVFDCGARKAMLGPERLPAEHAAIAGAAGAPFGGLYTYGEVGRASGARGMHHLTIVTLALA